MWGDVSGDGRADYCRRVGNGGGGLADRAARSPPAPASPTAATPCRRGAPTRRSPTSTATAAPTTAGSPARTAYFAACSANAADSPVLDRGRSRESRTDARGWTSPATARPTTAASPTVLVCTSPPGTASAATSARPPTDLGYEPGRAWADVNGDQKADYCRRVGNGGADARIGCTLSTGSGFGQIFVSDPLEWGDETGSRGWTSTVTATATSAAPSHPPPPTSSSSARCGHPPASRPPRGRLRPARPRRAAGRAWVDHNGDGRADYCRVDRAPPATCTISNGTAFGPLPPARAARRRAAARPAAQADAGSSSRSPTTTTPRAAGPASPGSSSTASRAARRSRPPARRAARARATPRRTSAAASSA